MSISLCRSLCDIKKTLVNRLRYLIDEDIDNHDDKKYNGYRFM